MKNFKCIIIGSGASGVMCALAAKNKNVALLDIGSKPAKKILATGNGRCNLTNLKLTSQAYNRNLDKYLEKFNVEQTLKFFESLGLECYADEENRVYPISNSAKSVQDVMVNSLRNDVFLNVNILNIKKENGKFLIESDGETFECEKLVIATGGGSDKVLKFLNVCYKPFIPSLVSLKCSDVKDLNGIKISNVKVIAKNSKGQSMQEVGEVLFKDSGLSGICIFNISTLFARQGEFKGEILIDLLPNIEENKLKEKLINRKNLNVNLDKFFVGMFQGAIANEIFRQAKVNTNINSLNVKEDIIYKLVKTIKNLKFTVVGNYDNNQVYSGGVMLEDLNENLMSKKVHNLYFIGEVCDVDGVCGGYNLQWAWTSGHIVGEAL